MTRAQPTPEWMTDGLCRQSDGEAWFPENGAHADAAVAICRRCPVRTQCLDYALAHDERFGVWGGLTPNEREPLRRKRNGLCARCLKVHVDPRFRYCEPCRRQARQETFARYDMRRTS